MRKRVYIALAVLLVALVSVIVWQVLHAQEREPVYQGKPLSSWLKPIIGKSFYDDPQVLKADEALRRIGTNAIPTLLRMLRAKDSPLKVKLVKLARSQHFIKTEWLLAGDWNNLATRAFQMLGAKGESAVPALIEIVDQKISNLSQWSDAIAAMDAIAAIGFIGPSAKGAVPSLLQWATHTDRSVRYYAICALGEITAEPERVVPVLINALHDPDAQNQIRAVQALRQFGPDAKLAVPALVEYFKASHSSEALDALKQIDRGAAARTGVE
jgi:HEAT repeat protein